jgi:MoxR-like ATPase
MTLLHPAIASPAAIDARFSELGYLPDEGLSIAIFLSLQMGKPLLLEGAPGVGKTDAAKTLAMVLGRELIRLQCYEGIDAAHALYEWNYPRQLLALRQASGPNLDLYSEEFLIERPLLKALRAPDTTVLLIDEIDRSDHEFEAFLLEFLSDFQISIPELGTLAAAERPPVVLTSNRTRNVHEALRRRCIHHWIPYPTPEREAEIIQARATAVTREVAVAVARAVTALRRRPLVKPPSIAEAVDWARAAMLVEAGSGQWPLAFRQAIGAAIKDEEDLESLQGDLTELLQEACG